MEPSSPKNRVSAAILGLNVDLELFGGGKHKEQRERVAQRVERVSRASLVQALLLSSAYGLEAAAIKRRQLR